MADRKLALTFKFKGIDGLTGPIKNIIGATGGAQNNLRSLSATMRDQKAELSGLRASMASASGNITHLIDKERQLESQIAATTRKFDAQKSAISRVAKADSMGSAGVGKGTENLTTGVAMAAPLYLAGKAAAQFEDGMIDIRQKAGLTVAETAKLESNIIKAAKAAHELPENMRAGVDTLSGFGMTPQQAGEMIAPIGRASTAYRAVIAELSAASYANFDNLKVPLTETGRALDAMASAGKNGAFELKDMATFFPNLTAQAQALGQRGVPAVADLSAALQIARKGAGSAEKAATNVENLLAKINTEETEKKFAKFGVNLPAALKKAYAEGKTPLEAIAELTNFAVKGDLSQVSKLFGDMQAQAALRPLIQNMVEYRRIRSEAMKATGTVDADFAMRAETAGTKARALMGDLSRIALVAGGALLPAFSEVAGHLGRAADAMSAFSQKNPEAISFIVKTIAVIAAMNLAVGGARLVFGLVVGPLARVYNGFLMLGKLGPVLKGLIGFGPRILQAFTLMRTAALFLARGVMQAGLMMLANPMILAITAIVLALGVAGYLIYKHWDKIKAAFGAAWTWMQGAWTNITAAVKSGVGMAMNAFLMFTPLGWLIRAVAPALGYLRGLDMMSIGRNMIDGLTSGITSRLAALKSTVTGVATSAANWFKDRLGIRSPSRVFMGYGGDISDGLALGLRRTISGPLKQARGLAAALAGAMTVTAPAIAAPVFQTAAMASQVIAPKSTATQTGSGLSPATAITARNSATDRPAPVTGPSVAKVEIHIHAAAGQSVQDIGAEVERRMNNFYGRQQARARSAYRDDDA